MKCIATLLGMVFCLSVSTAQEATGVDDFTWLVGTWENTRMKPGERGVETWKLHPEGYLSGTGVTIRGTDTTFTERLRIMQYGGNWYYEATVSHNPAPVLFEITEVSTTGFVSENPDHDFPKKIAYRLEGEMITATISDGQKQIPFKLKRVE